MMLKLPELPPRYRWKHTSVEIVILADNTAWARTHNRKKDEPEAIGVVRLNNKNTPQIWKMDGWQPAQPCENLQQAVDLLYALFMLGECEHELLEEEK